MPDLKKCLHNDIVKVDQQQWIYSILAYYEDPDEKKCMEQDRVLGIDLEGWVESKLKKLDSDSKKGNSKLEKMPPFKEFNGDVEKSLDNA